MCRNVFNVWPKTTLLLPVWPRDAKRLDTPDSRFFFFHKTRIYWGRGAADSGFQAREVTDKDQ